MPFGDHWIARGDRGSEVASRSAVEREREIIRSKHNHGADRTEHRTDIRGDVNCRHGPRTILSRASRQAQLVAGAWKFRILEPWLDGKGGLRMRHSNQFFGTGVDPIGESVQESGKSLAAPVAHSVGRARG